jgi:uncharacterized membrane protein
VKAADTYTSYRSVRRLKAQAVRVWLAGLAILGVWMAAIIIAPLFRHSGVAAADPIYAFFSYLCHQFPSRSLAILGESLAVCSRCTGVYAGLITGFLAYPLAFPIDSGQPPRRFWLFAALIPAAIDWSLTFLGIWENTHLSRVSTGALLGITCSLYIVPALVEIARSVSRGQAEVEGGVIEVDRL